jgi:SpoVK/Ycf46/Vps4 family AAA+-type ATPase
MASALREIFKVPTVIWNDIGGLEKDQAEITRVGPTSSRASEEVFQVRHVASKVSPFIGRPAGYSLTNLYSYPDLN